MTRARSRLHRQWSVYVGNISWCPIITTQCIGAFSVSIKVITEQRRAAHAHRSISMHTAKRYDYRGAPPPLPLPLHCPAPKFCPTHIQWVYMCVYVCWGVGERWHGANMEPAKYLCLGSTGANRTGRKTRYREVLQELARRCSNAFLLVEKKGERWLP